MLSLQFLLSTLSLGVALIAPSATASPLDKRDVNVTRAVDMGTGTYPRITRLKDGSILGCFADHWSALPNTVLRTVRSEDNGATWVPVGSIAQEPRATRDLDNCFIHQLPSGHILGAFRNHDWAGTDGSWTYYRLIVVISRDNGQEWEYVTTLTENGTPGLGVWEPFIMDALDGSTMLYFSRETDAANRADQNSILVRSTDEGQTWSAEQIISGKTYQSRDGMVGVARLGEDSRNLVAVFEVLNPNEGITAIFSSDDGTTWSENDGRTIVYNSEVVGDVVGAPQIVYVEPYLVVSFQTKEDDLSSNDHSVKVVVSSDGGHTWGEKTTVRFPCNWAGELPVEGTTLLVVCEAGTTSYAQNVTIS